MSVVYPTCCMVTGDAPYLLLSRMASCIRLLRSVRARWCSLIHVGHCSVLQLLCELLPGLHTDLKVLSSIQRPDATLLQDLCQSQQLLVKHALHHTKYVCSPGSPRDSHSKVFPFETLSMPLLQCLLLPCSRNALTHSSQCRHYIMATSASDGEIE